MDPAVRGPKPLPCVQECAGRIVEACHHARTFDHERCHDVAQQGRLAGDQEGRSPPGYHRPATPGSPSSPPPAGAAQAAVGPGRASATPTIRRLPEAVANRIAAGVVVECSAPVVKELVDNAIDACTSRLEVALEGGGKGPIEVVHDGCGTALEELALEHHAHSNPGRGASYADHECRHWPARSCPRSPRWRARSRASCWSAWSAIRRGSELTAAVLAADLIATISRALQNGPAARPFSCRLP